MKKSIFLSVVGFFIVASCTTSTSVSPSNTVTVDTTKISSLITQKCSSCHSTKTKAADGVSYDSYDDMLKGVNGIKKTVVTQRSMPRGSSMTEEEITLIKQWAEQVSK
jgi:uncharacterized membrane protein